MRACRLPVGVGGTAGEQFGRIVRLISLYSIVIDTTQERQMKTSRLAALLTCVVLALPLSGGTQDTPKDKPAPQEAKPATPKDVVKSMAGAWEGTSRTWFRPDKIADESK